MLSSLAESTTYLQKESGTKQCAFDAFAGGGGVALAERWTRGAVASKSQSCSFQEPELQH
ncbi:hypothetical protein SLEP1_g58227 [Rubroshorea leprosula]|uniref:Uncharacterized protein n=1 Tax=Rubroshorea leprosula TaxID=152421 RepID=A0AAV5MP22_9ROSI|nr:hypothetical protein SLEP1_g58227 [Rubroshorea leprosula]